MSVHFAERLIDYRRAHEPLYMARMRFELFVYWHRSHGLDVDTTQHYLISKVGQPPREALRITRVGSIRAVEQEPTMQPVARDEVAEYAEVMQRWSRAHEAHHPETTRCRPEEAGARA